MAKTNKPARQTRYTLEVTFTVDFTADEQLQTAQGVREEARSWLENLGAAVQAVTLRRAG